MMDETEKWNLEPLPVKAELETKAILKKLPKAHTLTIITIRTEFYHIMNHVYCVALQKTTIS